MRFDELFQRVRAHGETRLSGKGISGAEVERTVPAFLDDVAALAQRLLSSGAVAGMQIALQSSNCYEYLVWDLAAIKLGLIIHAVPEDLPQGKLEEIARKQSIALWVYENEANVTSFENMAPLSGTQDASPLPVATDATPLDDPDLLTRVYSSGTSGYLKGLNISRHGTELLVSDFIEAFHLDTHDSHLIFLPLSNYQQRMSVYACLWSGSSFRVVRYPTLFQELGRYAPTFIIAPPAIYENVHNAFGRGAGARDKLRGVLGGNIRFMITGMAPIRKDVQQAFNDEGFPLLEAYGVTETGMIAWNTPKLHRIGAVGQLIHADHVDFSDEAEIVIRRPHPLSKGYFESAGSDGSNTFLADGRIATGDIGSVDADGFLTLRGRKKEIIVTSGGAKFHPEEVERALASSVPASHAIVLASRRDGRIVAVLVTEADADEALLERIDAGIRLANATLPGYMGVAHRVVTQTPPSIENGMLTRNLKYDRNGVYRHFQAGIEMQEEVC